MKLNIGTPFGKALSLARRKAMLTQEKLAQKAQLDRTYISLLERGQRKPSLECVMLLATALDIDTLSFVDEFLKHFNTANADIYETKAERGQRTSEVIKLK